MLDALDPQWMIFGGRSGGGGGGGGGSPPLPPKMLGSVPISSASDAYNVFKMDVMSDCLSGYATHPKYDRGWCVCSCGSPECDCKGGCGDFETDTTRHTTHTTV